MSTLAPITPLVVVFDTDDTDEMSAAVVAETYTTMLDELAAMVEDSAERDTLPGRVIARRFGELVVALDELTITAVLEHDAVVQLANDVDQAHDYIEGCTFTSAAFRSLLAPLVELHAALVDLVSVAAWTEATR